MENTENVVKNPLEEFVGDVSKHNEKIGEVIRISINQQEKKILESFTKSPFFNDIVTYLNQIILDGTINSKDANKIDDFIIDWTINNEDQMLPQPLQFLQRVIIPKIMGDVMNESAPNYGAPSATATQKLEPVIDDDNLPTYMPKIHDIIEREVRRRGKLENKGYLELKKKYDELVNKMAGISKLFTNNM